MEGLNRRKSWFKLQENSNFLYSKWFTLIALVVIVLFNIVAIAQASKLINESNSGATKTIVISVSIITSIIHLISCICGFLGICVMMRKLLIPWMIISCFQFGHYFFLMIYGMVEGRLMIPLNCLIYLAVSGLIFFIMLNVYQNMRKKELQKYALEFAQPSTASNVAPSTSSVNQPKEASPKYVAHRL